MKKTRIKFSFIIPTFREEKFIGRCLGSIEKQRRKDHEVIVVDSYSDDKTIKIAKKHKAKVMFEGIRGPGAARNKGAKNARGEILIFADADVRFEEDFLERLEKEFSKDIGGGICKLIPYDADSYLVAKNYKIANVIARFMISIGVPMTTGSCFIYRKPLFEKSGGFDTKFLTNEDHDVADRISKMKRFVYFNDIRVGTSTRRVKKWGLFRTIRTYFKSTVIYFLNHSYIRSYWN
ncbi:glycosyltransferase family 2 protein [archaeon]|nr:glycosyltransferase family 2 protein [archaeon]